MNNDLDIKFAVAMDNARANAENELIRALVKEKARNRKKRIAMHASDAKIRARLDELGFTYDPKKLDKLLIECDKASKKYDESLDKEIQRIIDGERIDITASIPDRLVSIAMSNIINADDYIRMINKRFEQLTALNDNFIKESNDSLGNMEQLEKLRKLIDEI